MNMDDVRKRTRIGVFAVEIYPMTMEERLASTGAGDQLYSHVENVSPANFVLGIDLLVKTVAKQLNAKPADIWAQIFQNALLRLDVQPTAECRLNHIPPTPFQGPEPRG
jgi:hypothetical protein